MTIEPSSGKSRTSQAQNETLTLSSWRSSAQLPQVVDVERQAAAEDGDDQAQADDDLTGGDDHHDHGEDLALAVADHAAEGDQRQVAGVQHQLEAEEDHHRAAADQDADCSGGEEEGGKDDEPLGVHASSPGEGAGTPSSLGTSSKESGTAGGVGEVPSPPPKRPLGGSSPPPPQNVRRGYRPPLGGWMPGRLLRLRRGAGGSSWPRTGLGTSPAAIVRLRLGRRSRRGRRGPAFRGLGGRS